MLPDLPVPLQGMACANLRDGGLFVCGGNELYYASGPK